MAKNNPMNFYWVWDALKQGARWGFFMGASLGFIAGLVYALTGLANIGTPVLWSLPLGLLGGFGGSLIAVVIVGVIGGTPEFFNWALAFLGGGFLSLLAALEILGSGVLGWASITLVPILLLARKYLSDKLPEWIEKSFDNAIIWLLTSLMLTFLVGHFERFTGLTLFKL